MENKENVEERETKICIIKLNNSFFQTQKSNRFAKSNLYLPLKCITYILFLPIKN
jgi:hypothetical protein